MFSNLRAFDTLHIHLVLILVAWIAKGFAFDLTFNSNLAVYWGQDSYGNTHPSDKANYEKPLRGYCQDDTFDVLILAFLDNFNLGSLPQLDLSDHCNANFAGTRQKVLLSLGGAIGSYGFKNDMEGRTFADTLWNVFGNGQSDTRPFESAVVDGFDLDIEGGSSTGYVAMIEQLRTYYLADTSKPYYITGAPQ
ncbi:hypothetical protein BZG36_00852 [Bifiguratus adelaidae]|uniref:chitinase n=1 Tax=Bifiguratus adelaidae TaxID=1938954 RepID=A0A261Y6H3_9FUNG|nr:hypothetical protein BZG36_00852 [Bifiguratus adelaidae]